jgi:hypothetical protein
VVFFDSKDHSYPLFPPPASPNNQIEEKHLRNNKTPKARRNNAGLFGTFP